MINSPMSQFCSLCHLLVPLSAASWRGFFPSTWSHFCWLLWNSHMDQVESCLLQTPVSDLSHVGAAAEHGRSSGLSTCNCFVPTDLPLPEALLWLSVFEGFSFSKLPGVSQLPPCFLPQPSCIFSLSFPRQPLHTTSPSSFCSPLFP